MIVWDHWHLEVSSICSLQCARCPRQEVSHSLLNRQLNLEFFQTRISADILEQIKKITFCGNDGDPIYCREFLDICAWIKSVNPMLQLAIVTNGSHRPESWWRDLAIILDERDELHWSLDGWDQSSNSVYRKNCDWSSIEQGIKTFRAHNSKTYLVWACIAFRFNQLHLLDQQQLATKWGFDQWQVTLSTKFGSKYPSYPSPDPLEPDPIWVAEGHRFQRKTVDLTSRSKPSDQLKPIFFTRASALYKHNVSSGLCQVGNKGVFVNSRGDFFPCCWTATRYDHNFYWHKLASTRFNLYNKTFSQIINDPFWHNEFLKFDSFECTSKCTRDKLVDIQHITEW